MYIAPNQTTQSQGKLLPFLKRKKLNYINTANKDCYS